MNIKTQFEQLENQRSHLLKQMADYSDEILNHSPKQGKWSPLQVVNHLLLAESGTLTGIRIRLAQNKFSPKSFFSFAKMRLTTQLFKWGVKLKAPSYVASVPEKSSLEEVTARWNILRDEFRKTIDTFPDDKLDSATFRHPIFGLLTLPQVLFFLQEHFTVHRKQIENMLAKTNFFA